MLFNIEFFFHMNEFKSSVIKLKEILILFLQTIEEKYGK